MKLEPNKLYLEDAELILYAISLMPSTADRSGYAASEGLSDPYAGKAVSIREKLDAQFPNFDVDEVQFILWALRDYLEVLNKSRAVARKGTASYKRTHRDLKIVTRLIDIFKRFGPSLD